VRRRPGEELLDSCVQSTVKFQGGRNMIWGAMNYRGTGLLYHVKGKVHVCAIPTAHLLGYGHDYWYQDDGAPRHIGRIVKDWQLENDVRCLENWPPQSPDINEGDTPSPLAYCVLPHFGLAYCVPPFFGFAYCVPFNNKNNHFGRFHIYQEDKITVCCMHMYNHS